MSWQVSSMAALSALVVVGLAAPAFAADTWPAVDPTWQAADPSWVPSNWHWTPSAAAPAPGAMLPMVPQQGYGYMQMPMVPVAPAMPMMQGYGYGYVPMAWHPSQWDLQAALCASAARGDVAVVKALVEHGANVNLRDQEGYTPLTWAAQRGQTAVVKYLLAHWAQPNPADRYGYTPLLWAAQQGYLETCDALMAKGANPYVQDKRGLNALAMARISGNAGLATRIQTVMQTTVAARRPLPAMP